MYISYNWILDYIKFIDEKPDINIISELLTDIGLEVEYINKKIDYYTYLKDIYVGKILDIEPHKNADNLNIVKVDIGYKDSLYLVCGDRNISIGDFVPVAIVGSKIPGDMYGQSFITIKKSKIRGIESSGMICSELEISLGRNNNGVMLLSANDKQIGSNLLDFFNLSLEDDYVLDISLTPNRMDAMSHFGIARELYAVLKLKNYNCYIQEPNIAYNTNIINDNFNDILNIEIDSTLVNRYSYLIIKDIKVSNSPFFIVKRLISIGVKPINNFVDLTNFIMHDIGNPLHVYDLDKIINSGIIKVGRLPYNMNSINFKILSGIEVISNNDDIYVYNQQDIMSIGGIIGSKKYSVDDNTINIMVECAHFNSISIRKSSKRNNIKTEASFRFERGVDLNTTVLSLHRYINLICSFNIKFSYLSKIYDIYNDKIENKIIYFSVYFLNKILGFDFPLDKLDLILNYLGISILSKDNHIYELKIPSYRLDVCREIDVVEEIMRIYGYNNIKFNDLSIYDNINFTVGKDYEDNISKYKFRNCITNLLVNNSFYECITVPLLNNKNTTYHFDDIDLQLCKVIEIFNPMSSELSCMRISMLPSLLNVIALNINHRNLNLKIFEFGKIYYRDSIKNTFIEKNILSIAITGNYINSTWLSDNTPSTLFHLKSIVNNIFIRVGLYFDGIQIKDKYNELYKFNIIYNNINIGLISEINAKILNDFNIKQKVYYCHIYVDILYELCVKYKRNIFIPYSKFPYSYRDISFVLSNEVTFGQIKNIVDSIGLKSLSDIILFDEYKKIGDNKKCYGIRFIFHDLNKTMNDKYINRCIDTIKSHIAKHIDFDIRS